MLSVAPSPANTIILTMDCSTDSLTSTGLPDTEPIDIMEVVVEVYQAPVSRPVRTSFGVMATRPAVLIRLRDRDGVVGYGEVWCNFPAPAAHYRAAIVSEILAPQVLGRTWRHPKEVFDNLSSGTRIMSLQAGDQGAFSHAIAGIDIAVWDLAARRAGQPLRCLLWGSAAGQIAVYASGIGPDHALEQATHARDIGHRAFKLKVGFGAEVDLANLGSLRRELGGETVVAVDANQAWSLEEAVSRSAQMAPYLPAWLEEPLRADVRRDCWSDLRSRSEISLAAGENEYGERGFDRMIDAGAVKIIQPDATKWGGISGTFPVARRIIKSGARYYPHYLGGGIGLVASAHLLAAAGGDGLLELDTNPNPLRSGLAEPFPPLVGGYLTLSKAPGLGVSPDHSVSHLMTDRTVRTRRTPLVR